MESESKKLGWAAQPVPLSQEIQDKEVKVKIRQLHCSPHHNLRTTIALLPHNQHTVWTQPEYDDVDDDEYDHLMMIMMEIILNIIMSLMINLCICMVFMGLFMIRSRGRRWMNTRRTHGDIEWVCIRSITSNIFEQVPGQA